MFVQMSMCGCLLLMVLPSLTHTYKPVVIIHGLFSSGTDVGLKYLKTCIEQAHPGTNVTVLNLFNGKDSLLPMWFQVSHLKKYVEEISQDNPDGIHVLGFSQGGLIARGIVHSLNDHRIDTFISLAAPLMGIYGDSILQKFDAFKKWIKYDVYQLFYSNFGQFLSVAGYWKDPFHLNLYHDFSQYLAVLNNETYHSRSQEFKENFLQIKKLVLIGGPDDDLLTPWQSSHFGFYKANSEDEIEEMKHQKVYLEDSFGLQTLNKRGRVHTITITKVNHFLWPFHKDVVRNHILPWLT